MSAPKSAIHQIGVDVLGTSLDASTNVVSVQLGDVQAGQGVGAGQATSQNAELWQQWGFCSRPALPVPGVSAAQCVAITRSDFDAVVAGRDGRTAAMYGALKDGETAVFASTGQARCLLKADGSVTLLTTDDNTATGGSCSLRFDGQGLVVVWPWGSVSFSKANGLQINHAPSGAQMALGPVAGLPAPLDVIKSAFSVSAGVCQIEGSSVMLGAGSAFQNCAMNPAVSPSPAGAPGSTTVFVAP